MSGLLGQLALCGVQRRLALDVEQPGGQLVQPGPTGCRYWLTSTTCSSSSSATTADRAGVVDDLALGDRAVGHPHLVACARVITCP